MDRIDDHQAMTAFACSVARDAGKVLMNLLPLGRQRGASVEAKSIRELVSEADRSAEALIVRAIGQQFPEHAILGEEGGAQGANGEAHYRWHIDPLDGTTNFLHGHPLFCVSLGVELLSKGPRPEIASACVHLPYVDETFFATRGAGAFLNSENIRLAVSDAATINDALVATGFAYDRDRFPNFDNFVRVATAARGVRRCGAAAIDLAYVASGRYDAFWELGLRAHDVAAGALLVEEAGGRIGDFAGANGWLHGRNIIASNPALFDAIHDKLDAWQDTHADAASQNG